MDKIWYRNPSKSEVIGRCGRDEKIIAQNRQKSNAKKQNKKTLDLYERAGSCEKPVKSVSSKGLCALLAENYRP